MNGSSANQAATSGVQAEKQTPGEDVLRILLVDDEASIREALKEYLQAINRHEVTTAENGEEALALAEPGKFDCAFLDLKMPGMSGVELLGHLKEIDQALPVVIMTGFPSLDAAIDTMRQGASDFLIKPFNLGQVKASLERVVREQRLLRENLQLSEKVEHQERVEALNQELQRRIQQQNNLQEISEAIDKLQTSEDIYQGMADVAQRFLNTHWTAVLLLDRATRQLLVIAQRGQNRQVLGRSAGVLGEGICGKVAAEGAPMMGRPGMDKRLDSLFAPQGTYFCLPIKIRQEVFGVLVAGEKVGEGAFGGEDIFLGRFLLNKAALNIENIALYESMVANLHSTLGALVNAMEAKDPYTRKHSRRVTNLSVLTAQRMGLGIDEIEALRFAAYLHDIGKIGIKDYILIKNAKLSDEEYEHIKLHPVIGESIIKDLDMSGPERAIIRCHHERWDGSGYPDGLAGEDIPLMARIVAVADAFDAMTSDRSYRRARDQSFAVEELLRCAGRHFDPEVVKVFIDMLSRYQPMGTAAVGNDGQA